MAYERYDPEERRWREEHERRRSMEFDRERGDMPRRRAYGSEHSDRGFFGRMGDEVRSWFGEEDRDPDHRRDRDEERWEPTMNAGAYNPRHRDELESGASRMDRDDRFDDGRGTQWDRDPYRRTSFAGSSARSNHDLHYEEWRRHQMEDLDRDYHEFRRERQSRFEEDFGGWRDRRQSKRELLRDIKEHMEVVGSDNRHVGTVDRLAGDRIILARSDPQSGGAHHSLSCTDVDRVENGRVILDCSADKARERWRDENRGRALFEREDQGQAGPHILDQSFSGTYR